MSINQSYLAGSAAWAALGVTSLAMACGQTEGLSRSWKPMERGGVPGDGEAASMSIELP